MKSVTECHCINIRRISNQITSLYDSYLQPVHLTTNQFYLLKSISQLNSCSVSELANYVGLERTTLTRTIKPLMDRHLIIDSASKGTRNRHLQLTDEGKELLDEGIRLWKEAQKALELKIGKEKIKVLHEIEKIL